MYYYFDSIILFEPGTVGSGLRSIVGRCDAMQCSAVPSTIIHPIRTKRMKRSIDQSMKRSIHTHTSTSNEPRTNSSPIIDLLDENFPSQRHEKRGCRLFIRNQYSTPRDTYIYIYISQTGRKKRETATTGLACKIDRFGRRREKDAHPEEDGCNR